MRRQSFQRYRPALGNRVLPSLHGESLEITLTVPLNSPLNYVSNPFKFLMRCKFEFCISFLMQFYQSCSHSWLWRIYPKVKNKLESFLSTGLTVRSKLSHEFHLCRRSILLLYQTHPALGTLQDTQIYHRITNHSFFHVRLNLITWDKY